MTKNIIDALCDMDVQEALEEAAKMTERFDGMPCCVNEGYTKRQKEIFNEGQRHATSFVADEIRRMKKRYL